MVGKAPYRILTMFRIASLFLAYLAYLAVPAFADLETQTSRQLQMRNVVDVAGVPDSLSFLVTAITRTDLEEALSVSDATLTVFAYDDDAFRALPYFLQTTLLTPGFKKHLTEILMYHIFADGAESSNSIEPEVVSQLQRAMVSPTRLPLTHSLALQLSSRRSFTTSITLRFPKA
jgi:uncharacterized surface protein with fasciclin (FAS1) repeats